MIITDDLWQLQPPSHKDSSDFGDEPSWHLWTPEVLRRVAGAPTCAMPTVTDTRQSHSLMLMAWGPLLPLFHHHLGWRRVDLGLARWALSGFDHAGDPTLTTINELWGPALPGFTFWYLSSHYTSPDNTTTAALERLQPARGTALPFGNDNLHLGGHFQAATARPERPTDETVALQIREDGHATLVLPVHRGWYRLLHFAGQRLQPLANGRSWRVDVSILPIGFIGQFRQSRDTGEWFHGRHSAHVLGFET